MRFLSSFQGEEEGWDHLSSYLTVADGILEKCNTGVEVFSILSRHASTTDPFDSLVCSGTEESGGRQPENASHGHVLPRQAVKRPVAL